MEQGQLCQHPNCILRGYRVIIFITGCFESTNGPLLLVTWVRGERGA